MVISCKPENGDCIDSSRGCLFREFDCGERLIDGEHGSAKETNLLSGDDGGRPFAQAIEVDQRLRGGVPRFVLALQDCAAPPAASRVVGDPGGFFLQPFLEMRRPRIEGLYVWQIFEEIGKQARGMRDLGEW